MSLDFNLIEKNIQHGIQRLEASEVICPGLLSITDLLLPELLLKLQNYIFNEKLDWGIQEHHTGVGYHYDRKKINWIPESVIEETHTVLNGLTDCIDQRFNRKNKFLGLSIWKDEQSYQVPPHTDNPVIDISMQIYLNGNKDMDLGTKFQIDKIVGIPYETNCGYLMDNRQNIVHFYNGKPPKDYYRYSLYAIWINENK